MEPAAMSGDMADIPPSWVFFRRQLLRPDLAAFCVRDVEEDGRRDSIFKRAGTKANPEWSSRFDHGFSQIVD
jgi:hypothetical protein